MEEIIQKNVKNILPNENCFSYFRNETTFNFDKVIVCTGAWSKK